MSKFPVDTHLSLPVEATEDLRGEDLNMGTDCINLLAAAVKCADRVLTVSPNYANEIQSPEGGQGLHELLRHKGGILRFAGILNGISDEWNPRTDPHICANYGKTNYLEQKAKCKADLQRRLGLHEDPFTALIGFCGRLCFQKGVHMITNIIPWLMHDQGNGVNGRVQLIMMGKGENKYAQAYGTLPVVHETGGLRDSVKGLWDEDRDRDTPTGFVFAGFDENHLKERLYQALSIYYFKR